MIEARAMIAAARDTDWSPSQQSVLNAFDARPYAAFPVKQIVAIAAALDLHDMTEDRAKEVIAKLVRRKVLRSRVSQGVRLYELAI